MTSCATWSSAIDDVALGRPPGGGLAAHLAACASCAARLEERRAFARRIDRAIAVAVRAEPSPGLADRIAARVAIPQPRLRGAVWRIVPAGFAVALAVGLLVFVLVRDRHTIEQPGATGIATLAAWRSPTASLLASRNIVLDTPFTVRRNSL